MRKPRLFGDHFAPSAERGCVDAVVHQVGQPTRQPHAFEDEDNEVAPDIDRVPGEPDLLRVAGRLRSALELASRLLAVNGR